MKKILLSIICCSVSYFSFSQQSLEKRLSAFIQPKADSLIKKEKLPGILIGVFDKDEVVYYESGFADTVTKLKFDKNTVFEIGSITKTLTSHVLLKVLHDKKISDKALIYSYLPDSVQRNEALKSITFLSLMNHTSGLPRLPENINLAGLQPYKNYTLENLYSYLASAKPALDNKSNYSNLGAALAGVLAAKISGISYDQLLEKYVFTPLQIRQSNVNSSPKAVGYLNNQQVPYWQWDAMAPAGTVKLRSRDLIAYLKFLSGRNKKEQWLIDSLTAITVKRDANVDLARGWHTFKHPDGALTYWHNGGTYGFSTFAAFSKAENRGVVIVINAFNKGQFGDHLGLLIMQKLLDDRKP